MDYFFSIIVLVFFLISIYYTFKYRFIQFKAIKKTINIFKENKNTNAFSTFLVSLASHMGTGNLIGTAFSIIVGGIGTIFWMWIYAIFSSVFSIIENTIAQKYRLKYDDEIRGGSPFYIGIGLRKKKTACLIAMFLVLSNSIFFQPIQVNTISETLLETLNIPRFISLIILILFTIFIIFKGTNKIVQFSNIIVPVMSIGYLLIGLLVIFINIRIIPSIFIDIIKDAFDIKPFLGGVIFVGFKKSLFSHESGLGTAPTISSMAEVKKPIHQGYISCVGIFFDTLVICTITALMIIIFDVKDTNVTSTGLIINVFVEIFNEFGKYLGGFFLVCFALATVVAQYYLLETNLIYIIKDKDLFVRKRYIFIFKVIFIIGIILGVYSNNQSIWTYIDIGIILLGIVNLYAISKFNDEFKRCLVDE